MPHAVAPSPCGRKPAGRPLLRWTSLPSLSGHELAGSDLAAAQLDHGPVDDALRVGAPGVHARGLADLRDRLRLMDVPMQREHGLDLLDQGPHGGRADGHDPWLAPVEDDLQVVRELRGTIEARVVRGA